MKIMIGADPEFFLIDKNTGKYVSAFGLIVGNKNYPQKLSKGSVQVDGMALEINVTPADVFASFEESILLTLQELRTMIPKEFDITFSPTANFDEKYMDEQPFEAKMLGCSPDWNAWNKSENEPPFSHPTMRTAGGHVHLGFDAKWLMKYNELTIEVLENSFKLTKELDYRLGLPSILLDDNHKRRELYGRAGAFRPKSYGLEYRVLSSFWLSDSKYTEWVFNSAVSAYQNYVLNNLFEEKYGNKAQEAINNNDVKFAERFCLDEDIRLPL